MLVVAHGLVIALYTFMIATLSVCLQIISSFVPVPAAQDVIPTSLNVDAPDMRVPIQLPSSLRSPATDSGASASTDR